MAFITAQAACQQAATSPTALEPTSIRRIEVGVAYSNVGLNTCNNVANCPAVPPHNSFGPTLALNLTRHWAIDGSYDVTTGYEPLGKGYYDNGSVAGGRGSKALAGVRYSLRSRNYSLFAYGKSGAVLWSEIESAVDEPGTIVPINHTYGNQAYFAVGAGAGVEYSPSPRIRVRGSVGDLVVDYGRARFSGCSLCYDGKGTAWDHNSDVNVGVYAALGREIRSGAQPYLRESTHRFWDRTNFAVISFSLLAQTADAVGTQHFIKNGFEEQDGLVRPLVTRGWPGQVTASAIETTVEVLVMYGLHRIGHHRLERFFPVVASAPNAVGAYQGLSNWDSFSHAR